jgi:hypothetical protein
LKVDDLDSLPITSYDYYPVRDLGLDLMRIEAGRGCPFACTFCSTAGFFQRSFRIKSAERLVRELDLLHARYGVSEFKLDHDLFTVNRRKIVEFCEAVTGRGYRWRASARVDCVDAALLTTMAEAGCAGLYFGIETGSARMQQICQKRLDLDLVQPMLDAAAALGIESTASFITGYPEETEADQNDTLDMLGRCFRPGCLPQLHILAPEPGTPMFERRHDTIAYDGYGGPFNASLIGDDDLRTVLEQADIFDLLLIPPRCFGHCGGDARCCAGPARSRSSTFGVRRPSQRAGEELRRPAGRRRPDMHPTPIRSRSSAKRSAPRNMTSPYAFARHRAREAPRHARDAVRSDHDTS